jgi:hypothetical protein
MQYDHGMDIACFGHRVGTYTVNVLLSGDSWYVPEMGVPAISLCRCVCKQQDVLVSEQPLQTGGNTL